MPSRRTAAPWRAVAARSALVAVAAVIAGSCGSSTNAETAASPTSVVSATVAPTPPVASPTLTPPDPSPSPTPDLRPAAPNGQRVPEVPEDAADLADALVESERVIRNPAASPDDVADAGRLQQRIYRRWAVDTTIDPIVFDRVPDDLRPVIELQLAARREFVAMPTGLPTAEEVPAWEIVAPEAADQLLAHYLEAETASGIEWEFLAAINLVETGMGRIRGLSTAGAQGPMQFIPDTWDWIGEGDVNDPRDAILAAGRLLAVGGGPEDMASALFAYNQSDHYVRAVTTYADIMRAEPRAFYGLYHWEIYFFTTSGDVWLPVGYRTEAPIPVDDYLAAAPWSNTAAIGG
ncbi:MAG: lytic transglycosylase domain-containing protein [Acidimicrobiales bacterium]|nr:lytic transglycosylase domain-containing protein [Acidimicrobiales bacterium]